MIDWSREETRRPDMCSGGFGAEQMAGEKIQYLKDKAFPEDEGGPEGYEAVRERRS